MELSILHAIQGIHNPMLDKIMVLIFGTIVGSKGQIWVWLGILLFLIPKTRKCGSCILISYLLAYFIGDGLLKDLIARPRPCTVDTSVTLLIAKPSSCSCPSVHSFLAFASATAIFYHYRKTGILALLFAALLGFSRLYFFVHYPTDVLLGSFLGVLVGWGVCLLHSKCYQQYNYIQI